MAVAAWSGIAYRPTDDLFWAFLSPAAQKPVQPPKNICLVQAAEKKYILGIHPKKIINPVPFHSKAFVLLYKFETSWALLSRLSRVFFFAISGASNFSNFKHFKQLFMILSRLRLLTMWVVESPVLYLAFLKTILAALFRTFGLLLRFLSSKASFLQDHLITQHSDFPSFLAVSSTDKPINRSIHAHALT